MLDDMQKNRYDTDRIDVSTVTKKIDEYASLDSPVAKSIEDVTATNVFYLSEDEIFESHSFSGDDTILLSIDLADLTYKNIDSFHIRLGLETDSLFHISQVGVAGEISTYKTVNYDINGTGYVDETLDLSDINAEDLLSLIVDGRFQVFVDASAKINMATIKIIEDAFTIEFSDKLEDEIHAVANRMTASFDMYVDDEDIIIDFLGDGNPDGSSHDNADIDTINRLILQALDRCSIDMLVELRSDGKMDITAELNKGDV